MSLYDSPLPRKVTRAMLDYAIGRFVSDGRIPHLWLDHDSDGYTIGTHPSGNPDYYVFNSGMTAREAYAFLRGMVAGRFTKRS
jgi:hypothetical protein